MNFFSQMFSDVNGQPSTNRFISAFVALFPLIVWGYTVFKSGNWIAPSEEVLFLVAGGLTSKIVQRKVEETGKCDKQVG